MALWPWDPKIDVRLFVLFLVFSTWGSSPLGVGAFSRLMSASTVPAVASEASSQKQDAPCDGRCAGDDDCSPVCQDCVCSFGARLLAPHSPQIVLVIAAAPVQVSAVALAVAPPDDVISPPRAPSLAGVFHPPRA